MDHTTRTDPTADKAIEDELPKFGSGLRQKSQDYYIGPETYIRVIKFWALDTFYVDGIRYSRPSFVSINGRTVTPRNIVDIDFDHCSAGVDCVCDVIPGIDMSDPRFWSNENDSDKAKHYVEQDCVRYGTDHCWCGDFGGSAA